MKVSVHQIDLGLSHMSLNENLNSGSIYQKPVSKVNKKKWKKSVNCF